MGLLSTIGNWLWNGSKSVASSAGFDTSGYENDEAQKWQADQAAIGRQWQENMLQKQMDYQTEMWNKTNEYNSAKNQANRWREAGLNPYMMMSAGNSGIAQVGGTPTGMSAPSAGQGHSNTHYTPAGQFMANIASAKAAKAQERKTNAEAGLMEAQSNLLTQKLQAEVSRMFKGNKLMDKYADQWFDTTFKLQKQQENTLNAQEHLTRMDAIYRAIENIHLDAQLKANISNKLADTKLLHNLSVSEGYKQWQIMQDVVESSAREESITLSNQILKQTVDELIKITESDAFWSGWKNFTGAASDILQGIGSLGNFKKGNKYNYNYRVNNGTYNRH